MGKVGSHHQPAPAPASESSIVSGNSIDSLKAMTIQAKRTLPNRNVDFTTENNIPSLTIDVADETDIGKLKGLVARADDAPFQVTFDSLETQDSTGTWYNSGVPLGILNTKYSRDTSVMNNDARVAAKKVEDKYLQVSLAPLSSLDEITSAYDADLSTLNKVKRVRGLRLTYLDKTHFE